MKNMSLAREVTKGLKSKCPECKKEVKPQFVRITGRSKALIRFKCVCGREWYEYIENNLEVTEIGK